MQQLYAPPKLPSIQWTNEKLEKAIQGHIIVYMPDGEKVPYLLTERERILFEEGKQRGYILAQRRANLLNAFLQWCDIHHLPHVYIEQQGSYATVEMEVLDEKCLLNKLSLEKIRTIYDYAAGPRSHGHTDPRYSYLPYVDLKRTEFVAQSFVAIYKQNQGVDVSLPPFPEPHPNNPLIFRLTEAKKQRYITTYTVKDMLGKRWRDFCDAYGWPYLRVHEQRRGYATIEVVLPAGKTFTPEIEQHIRLIGQEIELKREREKSKKSEKSYRQHTNSLTTLQTVPTASAMYFIQSIARLLYAAGYFPSIKNLSGE